MQQEQESRNGRAIRIKRPNRNRPVGERVNGKRPGRKRGFRMIHLAVVLGVVALGSIIATMRLGRPSEYAPNDPAVAAGTSNFTPNGVAPARKIPLPLISSSPLADSTPSARRSPSPSPGQDRSISPSRSISTPPGSDDPARSSSAPDLASPAATDSSPVPNASPVQCTLSASPAIAIGRNGGSGRIAVSVKDASRDTIITTSIPTNLNITPSAASVSGGTGEPLSFSITSIDGVRGKFIVIFSSPCGSVSVIVTVTG